jgi:hypothetical protein
MTERSDADNMEVWVKSWRVVRSQYVIMAPLPLYRGKIGVLYSYCNQNQI